MPSVQFPGEFGTHVSSITFLLNFKILRFCEDNKEINPAAGNLPLLMESIAKAKPAFDALAALVEEFSGHEISLRFPLTTAVKAELVTEMSNKVPKMGRTAKDTALSEIRCQVGLVGASQSDLATRDLVFEPYLTDEGLSSVVASIDLLKWQGSGRQISGRTLKIIASKEKMPSINQNNVHIEPFISVYPRLLDAAGVAQSLSIRNASNVHQTRYENTERLQPLALLLADVVSQMKFEFDAGTADGDPLSFKVKCGLGAIEAN